MFRLVQKGQPSEDCLYLNVFAPTWDPPSNGNFPRKIKDQSPKFRTSAGFPVMVYIHGGGMMIGDSASLGDEGIGKYLVRFGCSLSP